MYVLSTAYFNFMFHCFIFGNIDSYEHYALMHLYSQDLKCKNVLTKHLVSKIFLGQIQSRLLNNDIKSVVIFFVIV